MLCVILNICLSKGAFPQGSMSQCHIVTCHIKRGDEKRKVDIKNSAHIYYSVIVTIDSEDVKNLPVGFRLCYVDWLTASDGDRFA